MPKKKTETKATKKKTAKPKATTKKKTTTKAKTTKPKTKKTTKSKTTKKTTTKKTTKKQEVQQPELNIGLFGHVDHGKTTLTERLSGKWTDTHSEEMKRGITIRLGYADTVFRKCKKCPEPDCYTVKDKCPKCKGGTEFLRKVSFVDAPGHESLMATMLAGATIIDGAILLVSANETCPQPQTREHLQALNIMGIKNLVVVQNKMDLVDNERTLKNFKQIKDFLKGTPYENAPIIPVSAMHGINIDALIQAIQEIIPTPKRNPDLDPMMYVARSFDINKPGCEIKDLKGGILGGSLIQGKLKLDEEIEIRPGYPVEEQNKRIYKPIKTKIVSIVTGGKPIKEVIPGGSIAVMTLLDPSIVKSDTFTGAVVGIPGKLPDTRYDLELEVNLLDRVVGSKEDLTVELIKLKEVLMLNVNSAATVGFVTDLSKNTVKCNLKIPVCCDIGARVTISRRIKNRFRLIGFGILK